MLRQRRSKRRIAERCALHCREHSIASNSSGVGLYDIRNPGFEKTVDSLTFDNEPREIGEDLRSCPMPRQGCHHTGSKNKTYTNSSAEIVCFKRKKHSPEQYKDRGAVSEIRWRRPARNCYAESVRDTMAVTFVHINASRRVRSAPNRCEWRIAG